MNNMGFEKGCPCCRVYKDGVEFKKVMQLEKAGLVIYRHTTPVNSVASVSQPEKAFNTKDNVFIIHNTKNTNVSTSNYMSEFEQAINCPRCRYMVKQTKELLLTIPFVRKKDVIGICDHCRFTKRNNEHCNKCQGVVEEFLRKQEPEQTEMRDSDKHEKVMISKIRHILKDAPTAVFGKSKTQPRSETSLKNRSLSYKTSTMYHVPRVKDMFDIAKKTEKNNQRLKKGYFKQIKTTELYKNKSDSEITFIEAKSRQKHSELRKKLLFNSTENIAWPESLKESAELIGLDNKHQHRLRQKLKPNIDMDHTLKRLPSRELEEYLEKGSFIFSPVNYETKKWPSEESGIHEKENIKNIKKYQHSYGAIDDSKYDQEVSKSYDDIHCLKYGQEVSKSYDNLHHSKYDQEVFKSPQIKKDIFLKGIQKQSRSVHNIRPHSSEETLLRSGSATTDHKLRKDFSYFFIKETDVVKKPPRKRVSSSELIKDTQDMYRARAEEERIKNEQELKEKHEAEEKKRLAKIERQKHLEEERRLEELKKKKAEDDKKKLKQIEEEKQMNKIIPSKPDTESREKSVKSSKDTSGKSKSIKLRTEIKESKIDKSLKSERDSIKSKKEQGKQEKEELMRLEKERKLKEKLEKEEQMRRANEAKQRQKEEKEKEKANKEEQMRIAKEETRRQKEEKEKEKANKEEQMSKDKEETQRQKDEKEKEKANKEEQMRKDKEEKQRQKEEKQKQEEQLRLDKEQKQREKEQRLKEKEERQKEKEENRRQKKESNNVSKDKEQQQKKKEIEQQLLADQQNDKESKLRKKQEENEKKKEAHLKLKSLKETKAAVEPLKSESKKITEESKMKDLNINQIKVRKNSPDDLILQLVKLKQTQARLRERPTRLSQINISKKTLHSHMGHKNKTDKCIICLDSELELDIENIRLNETKPKEIKDIIIGPKIFKYQPSLVAKKEDKEIKPLFFTSTNTQDDNIIKTQEVIQNKSGMEKKPPVVSTKYVEQEAAKGVIRYALSDRTFIEKGWTMLPTEKVVRKMNVYRMRLAHPEFDWFEHNKNRKLICYDTGEKLAEFDDNGKCRWFYRNGKVALDYYDAEETNAQQRIIIFSSGEPDERGCSRPSAILATFDYLGNGVVFDHAGKIRLKYNQTEGVVLDRAIGPVSHWKWHTLNDPPALQQVMIDTQMAHKDPDILKLAGPHDNKPRPDNEEMLAIEFDNFIKEKSKKLSQKFKPFQIKMKALKINEYFSLKVLDQATIYLIYRDGSTNLKLNIGMILDHQEIVDTDTAEVGEVSNSLERFPARTDSLADLQKSVAHAQRVERARVEREQRLRPAQPCASADRLTAGMARPRPARPDQGSCQCKRPSTFNLYYDTHLI